MFLFQHTWLFFFQPLLNEKGRSQAQAAGSEPLVSWDITVHLD